MRWVAGRRPPVPGVDPDAGLDRRRLALDLAGVIAALRAVPLPPTRERTAELQHYRGEPLTDLDPEFRRYVAGCRAIPDLGLDLDAASELWSELVHQEEQPVRPPTWLHGDLLAENLLVDKGRLAAVLDFGGLAVGDPTVDLVVAWEVLDAASREVFREALGVDDVTWSKGRAWALAIAMMTFPYYWHSMPRRCADRRSMALAALSGR
jgi:aminoglycoside phosphotransferase (APT) family kinase protein